LRAGAEQIGKLGVRRPADPLGKAQTGRRNSDNQRGRWPVHAIYRYPVKGLSPEPLARTQLAVGATLLADRLYAIEN